MAATVEAPRDDHARAPSGAAGEIVEGVRMLREVARDPRVDDRARARLEEVSSLLSTDLGWLSAALAEACERGASPAREAALHLVMAGGKRVRPLATLLSAAAANGLAGDRATRARAVALAAELIHSATLLHDDVLDDAPERRGRPTSRIAWGNAVSVLSGDLLLVHALEVVNQLDEHRGELLGGLLSTLRALVDGEVIQLRGRTTLDLSEATYERVVHGKTASLFAWGCRAGALAAHADAKVAAALGAYGAHVGVAFQIVDDLLDVIGDERVTGKSLVADVREGKPTLPLLRAIARVPSLVAKVRTLREEPDDALAREVCAQIRASGACDEVRARAESEASRAVSALESVPAGPARDALAAVALDLVARTA